MALSQYRFGETELAVQLQGSGLDRKRPGSRPRLGCLVNDPWLYAQFGEPQGKYQSCRSRTDNEYVTASGHGGVSIEC